MIPQALHQLNIAWVLMTETGRYNPVYQRPYETNVDGHTLGVLVDRIEQTGAHKITEPLMSGIASNIAAPSAGPQGNITIPNGWEERRIRFIVAVEYRLSTGSTGMYYIQGYTDYPGVSAMGSVDPNMTFTINSYTTVNRMQTMTPMGNQYIDTIQDSAQVFCGPDGGIYLQQNPMHGLRPEDIYNGMQAQYLSAGAGVGGDEIIDGRTMIMNRPVRSARGNNVPAHYVGSILNAYMTGMDLSVYGQGEADIVTRSQQLVAELSINENHFFRMLTDLNGGYRTNKFKWQHLMRIDPTVDSKTRYIALGEAIKTKYVHDVGQTEYWAGSNRLTQMASLLSNAVPSIMMEHMIQSIHFRSTNHDIGGRITTALIDAKSLTNVDMRRYMHMFIERFEKELVPDITFNGHEAYMLEMRCDLFGETWITLSLGNEPMTSFVVPSFCDALYAPVITQNKEHFNHVVHDLSSVVSHVTDEVMGNRRQSGDVYRVADGI